jgi:large subunit ribosomal protein L29
MKAAELRPLEGADLVRRDSALRQELFNLRFQFATRQLTNTARFRQVRRDIARIETIMRERELEAEPENG